MVTPSRLDARFEAQLDGVREDRRSGATALSRILLDTLAPAIRWAFSGADWRDRLRSLSQMVGEAQPAMGAFQRWADRLESAAGAPRKSRISGTIVRQVRRERASLAKERTRAVAIAVAQLPMAPRVVTISRSDLVERTFCRAHRRDHGLSVVALESLPGGEGRALARVLRERAVPVQLVSDPLGRRLVRTADLVLIGADAVYGDGAVVHKAGTRALVRAARVAGVPVYVVSGSSKWTGRQHAPSRLPHLYDVTPGTAIRAFWTDRGVRVPSNSSPRPARLW